MEIVSYIKKETTERYVTVLFESCAYQPGETEHRCLSCGFTMNPDAEAIGSFVAAGGEVKKLYANQLRFCPLCGSRFDHKTEVKGLYGIEDDYAEYFGLEQAEMQNEEITDDRRLEMIGEGA